jgi:hypothetical protein
MQMEKHHNFDTAYNETVGMSYDLFESFLQYVEQSLGASLEVKNRKT